MANYSDQDGVYDVEDLQEADAHGQAALLLIESLIHGLVAKDVISVADAVEIVDIAAEVKTEIDIDGGDRPVPMRSSLTMLAAISKSLSLDLQGE